MPLVRRLLARGPIAGLMLATALLVRLLIPAGTMIGSDHGHVAIELCSGIAGQPMAMMHGTVPGHGKEDGKSEAPCAFAGLAIASLAAVDPVLLAAHVAFIVATGPAPLAARAIVDRIYLRPPLRGPPPAR